MASGNGFKLVVGHGIKPPSMFHNRPPMTHSWRRCTPSFPRSPPASTPPTRCNESGDSSSSSRHESCPVSTMRAYRESDMDARTGKEVLWQRHGTKIEMWLRSTGANPARWLSEAQAGLLLSAHRSSRPSHPRELPCVSCLCVQVCRATRVAGQRKTEVGHRVKCWKVDAKWAAASHTKERAASQTLSMPPHHVRCP